MGTRRYDEDSRVASAGAAGAQTAQFILHPESPPHLESMLPHNEDWLVGCSDGRRGEK